MKIWHHLCHELFLIGSHHVAEFGLERLGRCCCLEAMNLLPQSPQCYIALYTAVSRCCNLCLFVCLSLPSSIPPPLSSSPFLPFLGCVRVCMYVMCTGMNVCSMWRWWVEWRPEEGVDVFSNTLHLTSLTPVLY